MTRIAWAVVGVMTLAACGPDAYALVGGAEEESLELDRGALSVPAMLSFVNGPDATVEVLDREVGLDVRAARSIVGFVRGPDGLHGTADDRELSSIAQLDALSWVGEAALLAIDRYATPRYGLQDLVLEGVHFSAAEAALTVAVCNDARLDATGLSGLARLKLSEGRPHVNLVSVASTPQVGPAALLALRKYVAALLGSPPPPPAPARCTELEGKRDGVQFTAAEACKALEFLNTARTSDMRALPRTALDFIYFGAPNRPPPASTRTRWTRLNEYTDSIGVGATAVGALYGSIQRWSPGGPTSDTVADTWARRAELVDQAVRFDRAYVTKVSEARQDPNKPWLQYRCGELRDAPGGAAFLTACFTRVDSDSATGCNARDCYAGRLDTWVTARGELARSPSGAGGYVLWLSNSGFAPGP